MIRNKYVDIGVTLTIGPPSCDHIKRMWLLAGAINGIGQVQHFSRFSKIQSHNYYHACLYTYWLAKYSNTTLTVTVTSLNFQYIEIIA